VVDPALGPKAKPEDKRILIIDDDESILLLMKTTFDIEGFQVRTAKDGREIIKIAAEFKPHLIITDLMMPGSGGYDVLRSLQGDPLTSKVPVVLVTGSHMNSSTKDLLKQESNLAGYFEKPVRPETLTRHVHKLLNTISLAELRAQSSKDVPINFNDVF